MPVQILAFAFFTLGAVAIYALVIFLRPKPVGMLVAELRDRDIKAVKKAFRPAKHKRQTTVYATLRAKQFCEKAAKVGWHLKEHEYYAIIAGGMVVGGIMGVILKNNLISLGAAAAAVFMPTVILEMMTEKYYAKMRSLLEPATTSIGGAYAVHNNFVDAVNAVLPMMQEPLKTLFSNAVNEYQAGGNLREILAKLNHEVPLKEMHFFTNVAVLSEEAGGMAASVMNKVSQRIRERRRLMNELATALHNERRDNRMLVGFLYAFIFAARFLQGDLFNVFTTPLGEMFLAVVFLAGLVIMWAYQKMTRIPE